MDLENGLLVLISDAERFRLGLSAVAIPAGQGRGEPTSTGFLSLGEDAMQVRILAENVAKSTGRMCMMIIAVKDLTRALMVDITKALKQHFLR
ncbi:MAG: hypothetical protein C4K47_03015 [Candidatus Thorarchaeota archaeon]|nr:MAG: hypothetical protein C4K47_03015 [Candidatus Thorarchaeota archaeon]